MNRYNIFVKILQDRISKPPVGIDGFAFSHNIVRKYGIVRNSGRLPSLIFLRLFGNGSVNKKNNFNDQIFINNFSQETAHFVCSFPISTTTVRAPGITLHSINSIANSYLQRLINFRNTGPEFIKPIYPEILYFTNNDHFFTLFQLIKKNKPIVDKNRTQATANSLIPKQGGIVNTIKNTIIKNSISHEYITNYYYETGDDIPFPTSTTTVKASGITLHSIKSIVGNYFQRFKNFTNEDHFFPLLQIIKKNKSIADKNITQATANILTPKQGGIDNTINNIIIKNTLSPEYITNNYYETGDHISFPTSTTTVRVPGITLHSINSIANNYFKFINIRNTGPEFNKPIYQEKQYLANEKHQFGLLQIIKTNKPFADENISQEIANISIPKQGGIVNNNINNNTNINNTNINNTNINNTNINNTIPHEYITNRYYGTGDNTSFSTSTTTVKAPRITLHSINPIANNYFQRFINIRNTVSKFNKLIYPEIQYFTNENRFFKLLKTFDKNISITDYKKSRETANISILKQDRIVNNINNINNTNINNTNINNTNINNTIPHEYITNTYFETGNNISFPISTVRVPGITENSINPTVSNYLQRFINIRNKDSKFFNSIYPEMQYFTHENHLFKLLQKIKINRPIEDEKISQAKANVSNIQQSRIVNNTKRYNHIIKTNSNIINYSQKINNLQNIGSRVYHPLTYGLHPSFNDDELPNKKIYQIQDVDLTYANEPVLTISTSQNANNVQEKIEKIPVRSINSTGINESLIKESSQHSSVHEIHMIADKVYKIIEKKISIEKDRRGLF